MKLAIVLFSLFSVQAWACPNFTGSYVCQNEEGGDEGSYAMTMTQRTANSGTIYTSTIDGEASDLIVDGKPHVADPEQPKIIYVAKCQGSVVKVEMNGPVEEDGQIVGSMKSNMDHFMSGAKLMTKGKNIITYMGQEFTQDVESYCTKN
jgi:hypothetical protein